MSRSTPTPPAPPSAPVPSPRPAAPGRPDVGNAIPPQPGPQYLLPPPPAQEPIYQRRWVQLVGAGVIGLVVGVGAGSASANTHQKDLDASKATNATLTSQLDSVKSTLTQTQGEVAAANQKAADAVQAATAQVKAHDAATRRKLAATKSSLDAQASRLKALQRKVTGEVHAYNANSIPGTGEFLVGKEIKPGIYHANASAGCYWSRLASLSTSNIIDNNNVDGPVTIQISASDTAFEDQGCATWHKIG